VADEGLGLLSFDMAKFLVLLPVDANLSAHVSDADAVAAAMTDLREDAPFSEHLRPRSTRGGSGVVTGVGKSSMLQSRRPSSSGILHKIIVLSVFLG
jgi:hypothetical protein